MRPASFGAVCRSPVDVCDPVRFSLAEKMMKRSGLSIFLVVGLLAGIRTIVGQQPAAAAVVPDELLVRFRPQLPETARGAARATARASRIQQFSQLDIEHLRVAPGMTTERAIAALRSNPDVAFAEPNYVRQAVASAPPNDPYWLSDSLWGLQRIMAQTAWTNFPINGAPVVVADIDTGVNYGHPDLAGSMWRNPGETPGNGVDDDGNGYVDDVYGIDTLNRDSNPIDDNGHGTHVAGTIAATANNGIGVVGVNGQARILACKFLDAAGSGSDAGAVACFNYVVAMKKRGVNVRVTSNSWGSPRSGSIPQALLSAIDAAGAVGILNVFAAGNKGTNNDVTPFDPASLPLDHIVSVAASDAGDSRASFSNYGAVSVDLAAPGVSIVSTYGSGYGYLSGTSMAAPHISGAASFLFAVRAALSPTDVKTLLLSSVDRLGNWDGIVASGGRLNLFGAGLAAYGNVASPNGSTVPPLAQIVDDQGSVWTLGANQLVLRNGQHAAGGYGSRIVWTDSTIYVLGTDGNWWRWTGGGWTNVGATQPGGGGGNATSPDGTVVPPASQIVDAQGAVWTIGAGQTILRNGQHAAAGYGSQILWTNSAIYVFGTDGNWWKWTGGGWTNVGGTPGGGPGTSPNGTTVPPASQIVDAQGGVWTIGGSQMILRNGQLAASGYGSQILWLNGAIYVFGTDSNWYRWTSAGWNNVGPAHP
jgi:subtilisin family serine protease